MTGKTVKDITGFAFKEKEEIDLEIRLSESFNDYKHFGVIREMICFKNITKKEWELTLKESGLRLSTENLKSLSVQIKKRISAYEDYLK